jgi:hypothetical protein
MQEEHPKAAVGFASDLTTMGKLSVLRLGAAAAASL